MNIKDSDGLRSKSSQPSSTREDEPRSQAETLESFTTKLFDSEFEVIDDLGTFVINNLSISINNHPIKCATVVSKYSDSCGLIIFASKQEMSRTALNLALKEDPRLGIVEESYLYCMKFSWKEEKPLITSVKDDGFYLKRLKITYYEGYPIPEEPQRTTREMVSTMLEDFISKLSIISEGKIGFILPEDKSQLNYPQHRG